VNFLISRQLRLIKGGSTFGAVELGFIWVKDSMF